MGFRVSVPCGNCILLLSLLVACEVLATHEEDAEYCDGTADSACHADTPSYAEPPSADVVVSLQQLKDMQAAQRVQLFDVREPYEFEEGMIPGSTNIPLGEVGMAFALTPDQFKDRYGVPLPQRDDADMVLLCQRGIRSLTALETVWALGYSRARHYAGGYSEWARLEGQREAA